MSDMNQREREREREKEREREREREREWYLTLHTRTPVREANKESVDSAVRERHT